MKKIIVSTMVVVLGVMLMPAFGDSITFRQGIDGYSGCVDIMLKSLNPTTNYSTNPAITVFNNGGYTDYTEAMIRFDDLVLPDNAVITKAQLILFVNAGYAAGTVNLWAMQKDWEATTTTWRTNDPAWTIEGARGTTDRGSAVIGTVSLTGSSLYFTTTDLPTSLVQSWVDTPSSNYGLQLSPGVHVDFIASEYSNANWHPGLYIEYDIIPEPASMGLILLGSVGVILRKRKM